MRLEAVQHDEGKVWDEDVTGWQAKGGDGEGEGEVDLVDKGIEEEAGERGSEVEMPGGGAPAGGLAGQNVVAECGELGPEREAEPEVGVQRDSDGKTDQKA